MAYFPMFVDIKDMACTVVGAGDVAYRKVKALLEFEADITVIGIDICEGIKNLELEKKIQVKKKHFEMEDMKESYLVIAATDDTSLNKTISLYCKDNKIPVNVVDVQSECSFIFPAYVKQGPITVGVTSSGTSPVITQKIKRKVKEVIPVYYGELSQSLGMVRNEVKEKIDTEKKRKKVYQELLSIGENRKGEINLEDLNKVIKEGVSDV